MKSNWVTTKEIAEIAECGLSTARKIKDEVNEIVKQQGYRVVNSKKAPRKEVLRYIGLHHE